MYECYLARATNKFCLLAPDTYSLSNYDCTLIAQLEARGLLQQLLHSFRIVVMMVSAPWRIQDLAQVIIICSAFRRDSLSNDDWYFDASGNPRNRIEYVLNHGLHSC
jgi:hypothetical protein